MQKIERILVHTYSLSSISNQTTAVDGLMLHYSRPETYLFEI